MPASRTVRATSARWLSLACLLGAACSTGSEDSEATIDPSFDRWCDQHLCDWQTVQGSIEQAATWHQRDWAVNFLQTPTQISQRLAFTNESASCLAFDTIADVAHEARLSVELDFNDDGVADIEQQIPALSWKSVPFSVRTPVAYDGVRVNVIKRGTGRAILAQMRVVAQSDCTGQPLTLRVGSSCGSDEVCSSRHCEQGHCTSLTPGASSE
jgi:hypothetical protein